MYSQIGRRGTANTPVRVNTRAAGDSGLPNRRTAHERTNAPRPGRHLSATTAHVVPPRQDEYASHRINASLPLSPSINSLLDKTTRHPPSGHLSVISRDACTALFFRCLLDLLTLFCHPCLPENSCALYSSEHCGLLDILPRYPHQSSQPSFVSNHPSFEALLPIAAFVAERVAPRYLLFEPFSTFVVAILA